MKTPLKIIFPLILIIATFSCNSNKKSIKPINESRKTIEMVTDHGTMVIELFNETPLHRDNFIKLVNESAYDSLIFHRVIEKFMIQGGDPDSRNASPQDTLGNGGLDYTIKAEFKPNLFHKKGALASARDNNPTRASSSIQFYIVHGKTYNDSLLNKAETRINDWLAEHYFKNDSKNQSLIDSLQKAIDNENYEKYNFFNDSIDKMSKDYKNFDQYTIPEEHRKVYKSIGGAAHLDQNYTVFGEVVKGLEVVDSIATVQIGQFNRPVSDVRIISVKVLDKE